MPLESNVKPLVEITMSKRRNKPSIFYMAYLCLEMSFYIVYKIVITTGFNYALGTPFYLGLSFLPLEMGVYWIYAPLDR